MRRSFFLILCLTVSLSVVAQNLVRNPSFEDYEECPDEVTVDSKKELIPYWQIPTRGTTDYYNSCAFRQVNVPDNIMGHMFALQGNAYAGIILIEQPPSDSKIKRPMHYREYLQSELISPLEKDSLYCIKFYFCIASYSTYAVNGLGLYISEKSVNKRINAKVIEAKPQINLDTTNFFSERDNWHMVCDAFRASGNEQFITIGNFYNDLETKIEKLDISMYRGTIQQTIKENKLAYYYIDYVSVIKISDKNSICCTNEFSAHSENNTK